LSSIDEYYKNRKLTYHKTWNVTDTQFPEGAVHWILYILEDETHAPYHYGVEATEAAAENEIRWVIGSYIENNNLL
jgi:hypothetical protein|tara:strand:+ start:3336 stop:3563 length:228 start_codon:yes stop_codon:yes gene_type:complete